MLVVRTWVVACQRVTVAEHVIAALCLVGKFQLALLVNQFEGVVGVELTGRITTVYDGAVADGVQVGERLVLLSELGVCLCTVEVDLAQTADDR